MSICHPRVEQFYLIGRTNPYEGFAPQALMVKLIPQQELFSNAEESPSTKKIGFHNYYHNQIRTFSKKTDTIFKPLKLQ